MAKRVGQQLLRTVYPWPTNSLWTVRAKKFMPLPPSVRMFLRPGVPGRRLRAPGRVLRTAAGIREFDRLTGSDQLPNKTGPPPRPLRADRGPAHIRIGR